MSPTSPPAPASGTTSAGCRATWRISIRADLPDSRPAFPSPPTLMAPAAPPSAPGRSMPKSRPAWADLLGRPQPGRTPSRVRGIEQAKTLGIPYRSADDVAVLDLPNIFKRTELLGREQDRVDAGGKPPKPEAAIAFVDATLGGIAKSGILVSGLMEAYFGIVAANHRKKSPNQLRVFKNRKSAACSNFVKVNGDMDIPSPSRRRMQLHSTVGGRRA